ncbi:hypothetical protein [Cupriavidus basilensis]|uniref:hypothetical protein n=1 Tax=Cupriavidus basilensis TaxID=68895 RepID=UPI0020C71E78|nr:hypothetical protein [Cupriavidus basilensis]
MRPFALMRGAGVVLAGALLCAPAGARNEGRNNGRADARPPAKVRPAIDQRAFMHGIGAASGPGQTTYIFFSSSGLPPRGPDRNRNWTHDIYVAEWNPARASLGKPRLLVAEQEAQEPVSVAQNAAGRIMLTFEDGSNTTNSVSQRYRVYGKDLQSQEAKSTDVWSGGHSGHVTAVADNFVVFYSDDWIDGGGVDNLGTGNGVYLKTYDGNGRLLQSTEVAPNKREWWPLIAGSKETALLAWQEFVPGETHARLKTAVYRPIDGTLTGMQALNGRLKYYTYSVAYVPALDSFLLVGTNDVGKGFAHLLDKAGRVSASLACMPESVREAGITVVGDMAYTPAADGRLLHLKLSADTIELRGSQPSPIPWTYAGSLGLVRSSSILHWVSLTPAGLRESDFDLSRATPPSAADLCR